MTHRPELRRERRRAGRAASFAASDWSRIARRAATDSAGRAEQNGQRRWAWRCARPASRRRGPDRWRACRGSVGACRAARAVSVAVAARADAEDDGGPRHPGSSGWVNGTAGPRVTPAATDPVAGPGGLTRGPERAVDRRGDVAPRTLALPGNPLVLAVEHDLDTAHDEADDSPGLVPGRVRLGLSDST